MIRIVRGGKEPASKPRIDDMDRAIHKCLREDARMHCSEIARRLGYTTPRAVRNRLQWFREEGFITITAGAIPERLGLATGADIAANVEPGMVQQVARSLVNVDEVYYVTMSTGDSDISTSVVAASIGGPTDIHSR